MQTGNQPAHSIVVDDVAIYGKATGNGAAALVVAADGSRNAIKPTGSTTGAPTRTSEGIYTLTLAARFLPLPKLLFPSLAVVGADGRQAEVTSLSLTTGLLTVTVRKAADGAVDDLETTDTLYVRLAVQNSTVS